MGKRKTGIIFSSLLTILLLVLIFNITLGDFFFNKNDVKKILLLNNITLMDDFEIIKNKSSVDKDSYHQFELRISTKDKERIIWEIKNSKDYLDFAKPLYNLQNEMQRKNSNKIYSDFKNGNDFIRQSYEKEEKYSPLFYVIKIESKESHLFFQEIMN